MVKRLTLTGSTLRPRTVAEKAQIARSLEARVWPLFAAGRCKPVIFKTFPLADVAGAHRLMETSQHVGQHRSHRFKCVAFSGGSAYITGIPKRIYHFVTAPQTVPKERKNYVKCPVDAQGNRRLAG